MMKKTITTIIALIMLCASLCAQTPKYVIYIIGDGMGINQAYASKLFNGGSLNFMEFPYHSFITTYSANSLVTDSAAAGTALATGYKTKNSALGVDADMNPVKSVADYAKAKGFGVGVITSVGLNDATPGAFYAHTDNRNNFEIINQQLIDSKVDFAAGPTFKGNDIPDWLDKFRAKGVNVFVGKDEYKPVKGQRVLYMGKNLSVPYAIDRKPGDSELADFSEAAIDYLYTNYKKGFFLMIEGGKIDGACHADDAATAVKEVIDMAKSVDLALNFYKQHPNETLIIVTADHETGGFTMGAGSSAMHPEILANQKVSKDVLARHITALRKEKNDNVSWNDVKELLKEDLGLWDTIPVSKRQEADFTQVYKEVILDRTAAEDENLYSKNDMITKAAIDYVDKTAMTTYSFGSHSGTPVGLYTIGVKADSFKSCMDNTDVPKMILSVTKWK